jgi:hypothetical protein
MFSLVEWVSAWMNCATMKFICLGDVSAQLLLFHQLQNTLLDLVAGLLDSQIDAKIPATGSQRACCKPDVTGS